MEKMKKLLVYFILFIVSYFAINVLIYFCMKEDYKDISNCEIKTESPKIVVTEAKTTYSHGYIKGNITNDTGQHIQKIYLQIDLYNTKGIYLGTEIKEINYFNVNETINFDINYRDIEVNKIELSLVDEATMKENKTLKPKGMTDAEYKIWLTVGVLLGLYMIIP